MKNYKVELLYDNGTLEIYETGVVSEEKATEFINASYEAFREGTRAVVTLPNKGGLNTIINLSKVSRVSLLNI